MFQAVIEFIIIEVISGQKQMEMMNSKLRVNLPLSNVLLIEGFQEL